MKSSKTIYKHHRFPPEIIQYAVWLYFKFNLIHRDVEDLLAERGISVSYEAIRLWCNKFGSKYAQQLRRKHQGFGDTFFIDEVFVKIQGKQHYLWRAVDQDGEVVDVFLQKRRDGKAAKRFFRRILKKYHDEPSLVVTDKRIDKALDVPVVVLHVSGRLVAPLVSRLTEACDPIEGNFVLDLSNLNYADESGAEAIRMLRKRGAEIRGASSFINLLINGNVDSKDSKEEF